MRRFAFGWPEFGSEFGGGGNAPPVGPPTVANVQDGGNKLGTTATVTPDGEVTIATNASYLTGSFGVRHWFVRADNMLGKTLTVRRTKGMAEPYFDNDLTGWQMAWSYDETGPWQAFDSVTNQASHMVGQVIAPLAQNTVHIGRRPVFSNSRWDTAIARWRANPHTSPTPSASADFVIGTFEANAHAPAMDAYGFKFGTGPRAITITGTVHVDEHIAAYAYEGLLDWLLGDDLAAADLRSKCTFYCYPKINPQSRYAGASRVEVTTGIDANRIWTTDHDNVPLSKLMRDTWDADLPATIEGAIDFHDDPSGAYRGACYELVGSSGDFLGYLQAEYLSRTGVDLRRGGAIADTTLNDIMVKRFSPAWAVTVEHGVLASFGVSEWQQWGRDYGTALSSYYDTDGSAKWHEAPWETWSGGTSGITENDAAITVLATGGSPAAAFPIPPGKTIEIIMDLTLTNSQTVSLRQSPTSQLALADSTELHLRGSSGAPYRRIQRVTWTAQRPWFGLICARSNAGLPASFTLTNMVRYRVIP